MNELITYSNGLRLVVNRNPSVRSVAAGIWVGAGSAEETADNNGISHFTEHVMFKGTDKLNAFEIANAFESGQRSHVLLRKIHRRVCRKMFRKAFAHIHAFGV